MTTALLAAGLSLGLLSSLHCVGMCGPLALSLPLQGFSKNGRLIGILLYHFGRISSYVMLGLVTGMIGEQITIAGYQQWFSMAAGVLLMAYLLLSLRYRQRPGRSWLYRKVQAMIIHYLQHPTFRGMLLTGIGNGLLPCGMVYLAVISAAVTGTVASASVFMLCFGLGTFPLMGMLSFTGMYMKPALRRSLQKFSPYITACIAVMLILRGMNLDIPYISPAFRVTGEAVPCH